MTTESRVTTTDSQQNWVDLAQGLSQLPGKLQELGLTIPPGSRLALYARDLERCLRGETIHASDTQKRLETALKECAQILPSLRILGRQPSIPGLRSKVEIALGGQAYREREPQNTPARDAQFEIFLAGLLRFAGYEPRFEEPDVVFNAHCGDTIGIAAKRVKSQSQLRKLARGARNQLKRVGGPGIAALHLDFIGSDRKSFENFSEAQVAARKENKRCVKNNLRLLGRVFDSPNPRAILAFTSQAVDLANSARLQIVQSIYLLEIPREVGASIAGDHDAWVAFQHGKELKVNQCLAFSELQRSLDASAGRWHDQMLPTEPV